MFFPEFLFQLSGRDQQVTWLDPVLTGAESSAAASPIVVSGFTVPEGRALILQSASLILLPGAAQFVSPVNESRIGAVRSGFPNLRLAASTFVGTANKGEGLNWSGSVIIPPTWTVEGVGNFNAAVAANFVRLDLFGLLIPIGNLQRV